MKTLFVPLKFNPSKDCDSTLLYALSLARAANLQVIVFHAISLQSASPEFYQEPSYIRETEREKAKELADYVNQMRNACSTDLILKFNSTIGNRSDQVLHQPVTRSGYHTLVESKEAKCKKPVNITCVCKMGDTYEQLLCTAVAYDADLIIMGLTGAASASEPLVRSLTLSVMRHSRIPVLGVPKGARFKGLKSVVFASDLLQVPDPDLLLKLREFMHAFRFRLHMLHLHRNHNLQAEYDKAQEALEELDKELYDLNFSVIFQHNENIDEGIQDYVLEQKADMLVLSPYTRTFVDKLLNKSLTQRLIAKTCVPLLALPAGKPPVQSSRPAQIEDEDTIMTSKH